MQSQRPHAPVRGIAGGGSVLHIAQVQNALGLALEALEALRLRQRDLRLEAQNALQTVMDRPLQHFQLAEAAEQRGVDQLDLDLEVVHVILPAHHELVVRADLVRDPLRADEHALDLRGEHVDALDDQHVVGAAHHLIHTRVRAAACARLVVDARDVLRAVAQHREALAQQRRHHELARLARRLPLERVGVDDLGQKRVLRKVQAAAALALAGNARAAELRHAVVVGHADAEVPLDPLAHLRRAALAAEDAVPQLVRRKRVFALAHQLAQVDRVRRRRHKAGHAEVAHHHQLLFAVARRRRDDRRPELFKPVVQAERAGEQAVAERDLDDVLIRHAGRRAQPRHIVRPVVEVVLRVRADGRLARRARGGVDAHDVLHRARQHPERVVVADIVLRRERYVLDVRERLDPVARGDPGGLQALVVKRHVVVAVVDHAAQPLKLQRVEVGPLHRLNILLVKHLITCPAAGRPFCRSLPCARRADPASRRFPRSAPSCAAQHRFTM